MTKTAKKLEELTVPQLRSKCKKLKLTGYSKASRDTLLEMLTPFEDTPPMKVHGVKVDTGGADDTTISLRKKPEDPKKKISKVKDKTAEPESVIKLKQDPTFGGHIIPMSVQTPAQLKNLKLWNAVCETNPQFIRPVKYGNRKLTSIIAQYQKWLATKLWGVYGDKWGLTNLLFEYIKEEGKIVALSLEAQFFHPSLDGKKQVITEYSNDIPWNPSGECRKKLLTDMLTKCLSNVGFNADVFLGRFDEDTAGADNRYLHPIRTEEVVNTKFDPLTETVDFGTHKDKRYIDLSKGYIEAYFKKAKGQIPADRKVKLELTLEAIKRGEKPDHDKEREQLLSDCIDEVTEGTSEDSQGNNETIEEKYDAEKGIKEKFDAYEVKGGTEKKSKPVVISTESRKEILENPYQFLNRSTNKEMLGERWLVLIAYKKECTEKKIKLPWDENLMEKIASNKKKTL